MSRTFISHYSGMPAPPPHGLPPFGSTGQLLKKISDVSYDTAWEDERVADADSIREAPIDTRMYGRQDAGWALVPHGLPPAEKMAISFIARGRLKVLRSGGHP